MGVWVGVKEELRVRLVRRRNWASISLSLGLLAGCGVAPPRSATPPRTLKPQPIAGHATSVLQGRQTWVTVHARRDLIVEAMAPQSLPHFVIPYHKTDCSGSGVLSRVGSNTVVTGCTNLWVRHQGQWLERTLPSFLGSAAPLTGTGQHWWFLTYGAGASGNESIAIWTSTNAGDSWTRLATSSNQPYALPYYGDKTGLAVDRRGGLWLTGITAALGHAWLYRGPSNARRWSPTRIPIPTRWADAAIASYPPVFTSSHHGYLPVTVNGKFNGLAIYAQRHATNHWTLAGSVPGSVVTTPWTFTASSSTSLWVALGRHLWVSHDAGTTWHVAWKTPPRWDLVSVSFSGPRDGALLAIRPSGDAYALWATRDGGKTWQSRSAPKR